MEGAGMPHYRIAWASDIGRVPHHQQDALLVGGRVLQQARLGPDADTRAGDELLLAVADGVTLGPAGDAASRRLLESLVHLHAESRQRGESRPLNGRDLRSAQFRLCQQLAESSRTRGAATTLVLAHLMGQVARILHVGDSRAYLLDAGGKPVRLTRDHTAARTMMEDGDLPECDEGELPSMMRMLVGAIVADYDADDFPVDSTDVRLHPGDHLALCSDGAIEALEQAARESDGPANPLTLVRRAMALADGTDNATLVVVGIEATGGNSPAA
jgi:protein phosphatase